MPPQWIGTVPFQRLAETLAGEKPHDHPCWRWPCTDPPAGPGSGSRV